jgi:curli biogenesis system outer membrane secretion channel CsgG
MRLSRITLLITLIACLVSQDACAADGRIGVGVMSFGAGDANVLDHQAGIITDIFISALSSSPNVTVYERRWIDAIGGEMRTGMSWLVDPSAAARIGKMAGMRYIVTGNVALPGVGKADGKGVVLYSADSDVSAAINVRVIDTETSRVLFSHRATGYAENPRDELSLAGVRYAKTGLSRLQERAVADAVSQVAAAVLENLAGIAPQDMVQPQYSSPQALPPQGQAQYPQSSGLSPLGSLPQGQAYTPPNGLPPQRQPYAWQSGTIQQGATVPPYPQGASVPPQQYAPPNIRSSQNYGESSLQAQPQKGQQQYRQPSRGPDPNSDTGPSLVYSFPLDRNVAAALEERQREAQNMLAGGRYMEAYAEFRKLAESYSFDYLSAYWAGVAVMRMNKPGAAAAWFDRALSINPSYRPALDARARINGEQAK